MRSLPTFLFLAVLSAAPAWISHALAQAAQPAAAQSRAQGERNAAELRQGMSTAEVQKLLGKPRRTALKNASGSGSEPWQGTLHWNYTWTGSSQGNLQVVFAARTPGEWRVNSWEWSSYSQ